MVELHGGTVHAHSPGIGRGATFTVKLPLIPVQVEFEESDRVHPKADKGAPFNAPDLNGVRVLVVDDEVDAREYVAAVLEECRAEVLMANSAQAAIDLLTQQSPDVLASDIGMPEADGYSLIAQVRSLPANQGGQIPAVALTAYARVEDRTRTIAAGFQSHLSKPVEPAELVAIVARSVEWHQLK
ncbi:response regulator [Microcoleus sp. FACHB-1515]|uniref:response regulator n=1 Tax=Cyanophyceae TaxID=3028117 RepID=UPI001F554423|nr:response regulator [Microcoleus sp. FACHB-1515]